REVFRDGEPHLPGSLRDGSHPAITLQIPAIHAPVLINIHSAHQPVFLSSQCTIHELLAVCQSRAVQPSHLQRPLPLEKPGTIGAKKWIECGAYSARNTSQRD